MSERTVLEYLLLVNHAGTRMQVKILQASPVITLLYKKKKFLGPKNGLERRV
jgi:hypothetical protein